MNISYWEYKQLFANLDYCIVGGGIVGLSTAYFLKKKYPKAKVLVLEKDLIGAAASSKNAGFACFGSVSEILSDIETFGENQAFELIKHRAKGLLLLEKTIGTKKLNLKRFGGYELFTANDEKSLTECQASIPYLNKNLKSIGSEVFAYQSKTAYPFKQIKGVIFNQYEAQLDTAAMYYQLALLVKKQNINVLRGSALAQFDDHETAVSLRLENGFEFSSKHLFITNNGFAKTLLPDLILEPARAQVLVTAPIKNLKLKGTFHYDEGYYYFRNIDNRILIGGGRNTEFENERTSKQEITATIQAKIETLLYQVILDKEVAIEHRWAGTMGLGNNKIPIVKAISKHVYCGVKMGGMGVAIGSLVGQQLSEMKF